MSIQLTREAPGAYYLLATKLEGVCADIRSHQSALVAFSGGTDSSVVAALAKQVLGDAAVAVTVDHGALRDGEVEHAAATAKAIGIRHLSITIDPWNVSEVKQNGPERCYYCKKLVFGALRGLADELRLNAVMDGTNASDLDGHRPGLKALRELCIVSPLLDFTKDEVRYFARALGLSNADAPSSACLLTSFPYGTTITSGKVERLREAEHALKALGIANAKVRDHNDFARIEVERDEVGRVIACCSSIIEAFVRLGFAYVTLDLQGLRSGSMDTVLNMARSRVRDSNGAICDK
ncbi:MAG: ATP-dependent sacrificial sulfur transferase LarE [Halobacteriota archaeon]